MHVLMIVFVVLMFGFIIFIHELGHFTLAKACGVRVHEFAIGMGPTIFHRQKGETKYALRLFPIGGFVAVEGEDEDSDDSKALCNKKVWQRILFVSAGAFMNLLMGFILMLVIVSRQDLVSTTKVAQFEPDAQSAQVLQVGDEILKVNGSRVHIANDILFEFINVGKDPVELTVRRNGQVMTLKDVPFRVEEAEEGIYVVNMDFKVAGVDKNIGNTFKEAWFMTTGVVKEVGRSFVKLVTGQYKMNQLAGPIGVSGAIGDAASMGANQLMMMIAFISINIGVFNLLPLPALDGGRLAFLLIEAVRGKPVPPKYEGYVHAAGMALLIGLMIFVTFNDIMRLIRG